MTPRRAVVLLTCCAAAAGCTTSHERATGQPTAHVGAPTTPTRAASPCPGSSSNAGSSAVVVRLDAVPHTHRVVVGQEVVLRAPAAPAHATWRVVTFPGPRRCALPVTLNERGLGAVVFLAPGQAVVRATSGAAAAITATIDIVQP